jgi:hypothetical protein
MTVAQDRFERYLRAGAREADGISALGSPAHGARNELRGDRLRDMADTFRARLSADQLAALERMSDSNVRALAIGARLAAPWLAPRD